VTVADMNNDGVSDIIAVPARGGRSLVEVIDGSKLNMVMKNGQIARSAVLASFYAYNANFNGVVAISTADYNSDGVPDIITSAGSNRRRLSKVIDGSQLLHYTKKFPIPTRNLPVLVSYSGYAPRFSHALRLGARHAIRHHG